MRKATGFTLTELVIVVALVGILAAVVIPLLQRAMIAANGGFYDGSLDCLVAPSWCIPSYPTSGPTFLDSLLASQTAKSGYNRLFTSGPVPATLPPTSSPTSVLGYRYDATPISIGITGVRGF